MKLSEGKVHCRYTVTGMELPEDVMRRFRTLGMTDRTPVQVLGKSGSGAMILRFRGSRFAIGRKFAEGISVRGPEGGGGHD